MNGRHTGRLHAGFQAEVEIRRVDADEDVRTLAFQAFFQLTPDTGNAPVIFQRIPVPHHRQLAHRPPAGHALPFHTRAADAVEDGTGQFRLERRDQMRTQQIPGGFACHQGDT